MYICIYTYIYINIIECFLFVFYIFYTYNQVRISINYYMNLLFELKTNVMSLCNLYNLY